VDNNYLDLGMNKSGFVHTLPSGRLNWHAIHEMAHLNGKKAYLKHPYCEEWLSDHCFQEHI
jgi:hypothetical protein